MHSGFRHFAVRAMRGEGGAFGIAARLGLLAAEPFYASAMRIRNSLYTRAGGERVPKCVISVGNITTGGTGKTPVVRWLAEQLHNLGHKPAILLRGYRQSESSISDEQSMLDAQLQGKAIVRANPDRVTTALNILETDPATDVILLDDGFQHRQMHRDFDLVVIDATEPFGFGHVLPRGLLREPLSGLSRAHAILITRAKQIAGEQLASIHTTIRRYNPTAPIYTADHRISGFIDERGPRQITGKAIFAFAGIGNPDSFEKSLATHAQVVGRRWFEDHHDYTAADIDKLVSASARAGGDYLVTTEKDWAKLCRLPAISDKPILRAQLVIEFLNEDDKHILKQITERLFSQAQSSGDGGGSRQGIGMSTR